MCMSSKTGATRTPGAGRLLDGKYRLLGRIGAGGMSNVWLARDERLGKLWAVKEVLPNVDGARGEALRRSILEEAQLLKRLDHPAIPRVVDILETGSTVFIVMDYVEGRSLGVLLRERGRPFDERAVIFWGIQLCDVLEYLHRANPAVIYRDMKPANVLVKDDGSVRLVDFGVSLECVAGRGSDSRFAGTPGYAPPEQLPDGASVPTQMDTAADIDGRVDVFSLGATLYSLVTGHVPHTTRDASGMLHCEFAMRPIRAWNPALSEGLEQIILRSTQTNPDERYQNLYEMRYDLEHYEKLSQEWRAAQRKKLTAFTRWAALGAASLVLGLVCMVASEAVLMRDVDACLHAAATASRQADAQGISPAERLYTRATVLDPSCIEGYRGLLEVYEDDYRLSRDEDIRWRQAYAASHGLEAQDGYRQLCFDVGAAYLCYFGIEHDGGAVGASAVASMDAAAPWFERVLAAQENAGRARNGIDEADLSAASAYLVVAQFYKTVARAGREGRSATQAYREFWDALTGLIATQNRLSAARRCTEGVRVRICQVAAECVSSPTYLAGFIRAGVSQEEARQLLKEVRVCRKGLGDFAAAEQYREVYGPVVAEIESEVALAERAIGDAFANPVVRAEESTAATEEVRA